MAWWGTAGDLRPRHGARRCCVCALWDRYDLGSRRWLRGRDLSWGRLRLHTTSLVSGLLFVAIGVVFLRYDGTAAGLTGSLGVGDLTDVEFSVQQRVSEWTAGIPAWLVLALVAAVALLVAWRRSRAARATTSRPAGWRSVPLGAEPL